MKNTEDPSEGQAARNEQQIKDYLTANQLLDKVTSTGYGMHYIITPPAAASAHGATLGEEVEFTYTLSYIDGNKAIKIDSATDAKPVYLPFLNGVVVAGLQQALLLMKEGQRGTFFMISDIAFGNDTRNGKMPAYSPVIFDVVLKRSRTEDEQLEDYASIKKLPAYDFKTNSGIRIYRLTKGTGPKVQAGQTVTVAYTANLLRGTTPFDKSDSLVVNLATGQYITGFSEGLRNLNVGDKAVLTFPSSVGYGMQGSYDQAKGLYIVPPYSPLAFEITVKSAK
ncbi:FKBP-type peptidyl-prolyl cis-trans isomerase [Larkinella soli]|uniref:FKBP-type peptidyl-prolyl cis-trans isomerase n=1 Tax=Larkinella soli TaxID=1770527 RepID=UPI0013E33EC1|nr:FKBP-type peptidyl-prolyl cis-trans isomerase [Larkinella soli]